MHENESKNGGSPAGKQAKGHSRLFTLLEKKKKSLAEAALRAISATKREPESASEQQGGEKEGSQEADETKRIPLRPTRLTSRYYFARTAKVWHFLLLSLPLDLLFILAGQPPEWLVALGWAIEPVLYAALIVATLVLFELEVPASLFVRRTGSRSRFNLILLALVAVGVMAEVFSKVGLNLSGLLIGALVAAGAVSSFRTQLKQQGARLDRLRADRTYWIEQTNKVLFILALAPLIAARLISPLGQLSIYLSSGSYWPQLLFFGASGLMLFALQPIESDFVIICRRCGQKTSRIFKDEGFCPLCEEALGKKV